MELKNYQKKVLRNLSSYLSILNKTRDIKTAYKQHWNNQDVRVGLGGLPEYKDTITGVPHVCFKVPTGGGKTFIACASLKPFFEEMPVSKAKVVAWLVPSNAILEQTIRTLCDVNHPYRQRIDFDFCGRVEVLTKDQLLNGQGFNPTSVKEQLTICVLSYDSIRSNKKDGRKMYQENSQLAQFVPHFENPETLIEDIDNTALIQVLNQLSPVVIVDESHNAQSDLSVEMLKNLSPSFVLDLTATPKNNSNIISYVDARELKKENMVKLPVVVYNRNSKQDVVLDAIQLRGNLARQAIEEEKVTGNYIRPIVLFQAQPKGKENNETFEKLKAELIGLGIPNNQIAIKTSVVNELKNINLLSHDCEIRYIITVNALKEGWDCPFAYILATLANKTSTVDVEQILGRILRQPYARQHKTPTLNMSYTITCSNDFLTTLDNIVKGLNKAGFSKKDYRIGDDVIETPVAPEQELSIQMELQEQPTLTDTEEFLDIDFGKIKENLEHTQNNDDASVTKEISNMIETALKHNEEYEEKLLGEDNNGFIGGELGDLMNKFEIYDTYKEQVLKLKIPMFFIKGEFNVFLNSDEILLTKESLSLGFTLKDKDTQLNFDLSTSDVYKVDVSINGEAVPKYQKATQAESKYFKEYFDSLPPEDKIKACKNMIYNELNKNNIISDEDYRDYVNHIVTNMSKDELVSLETSVVPYAQKIKSKIQSLIDIYTEKKFREMLDSGEIICKPSYTLPAYISPCNSVDSIANSLYESEGSMNDFERGVITDIASLENIEWWHRISERNGFYLNGFINHYPDFMVMTKKGNLVLIETKGDYLANDDSKQKLALGKLWQANSHNRFKYFMVFKNKDLKLDGAYILDDFIGMMRKL